MFAEDVLWWKLRRQRILDEWYDMVIFVKVSPEVSESFPEKETLLPTVYTHGENKQ